jgi:hypothetical protein
MSQQFFTQFRNIKFYENLSSNTWGFLYVGLLMYGLTDLTGAVPIGELKKLWKYFRMSKMLDSLRKRTKDVKSSYNHLDLFLTKTVRNAFYVILHYES